MQIVLDDIKINDDWKFFLKDEFLSPYFSDIKSHYILALKEMLLTFAL